MHTQGRGVEPPAPRGPKVLKIPAPGSGVLPVALACRVVRKGSLGPVAGRSSVPGYHGPRSRMAACSGNRLGAGALGRPEPKRRPFSVSGPTRQRDSDTNSNLKRVHPLKFSQGDASSSIFLDRVAIDLLREGADHPNCITFGTQGPTLKSPNSSSVEAASAVREPFQVTNCDRNTRISVPISIVAPTLGPSVET